jgi:cytochrome c oxidase subunit 4
MSDPHATDHEHHGVGHVAPLRALLGTGIALLFLTWVTVAVAEIDLGRANIYVALTVAVVKGSLVALFFMHLRWDRPFNAIVFIGSLVFVALFLAFAMVDTAEYLPDLIAGDSEDVVKTIAEQQQ